MSDEVDYSRFSYQEAKRATTKTNQDNIPSSPKKRKGKKVLFTFFVVFLCFALIFLCADFFGKGFLTSAIQKAFSFSEYTYYFVAQPVSSRFIAYASGLDVRQTGGAGYIYYDENYFVAYTCTCDEAVAQKLQAKNLSTQIYKLQFKTKESEIAKSLDEMTNDFLSAIDSLERGEKVESDLVALKNAYFSAFTALKSNYTDLSIIAFLDLVCDGMQNLNFSTTDRLTNLADIRYFLCCSLYSAKSALS